MGRKKCMTCKEWITGEEISAVIGKKPMHFCSEKCRDEAFKEQLDKEKRAADKDRAYRFICDIFGVPEIINTAVWKEWQVWNKVKTDEIIAQYLEENKDYLTQSISRLSSSEYAKIRYLSTILKNNLGGYKPKVVEKVEPNFISIDEGYETKYKPKSTRVSFDDLEGDF